MNLCDAELQIIQRLKMSMSSSIPFLNDLLCKGTLLQVKAAGK